MSRHIGIVACSPPGAALCYQQIATGSAHPPEVSVHAHPFDAYMHHIEAGDWERVGGLMLDSAEKLAEIGADFAIAPCNTIHHAMEFVVPRSPIPWLHIAAEVAREARLRRYRRIVVLGTRLIMESDLYAEQLHMAGIECAIPDAVEREEMDRWIFSEMVAGKFSDAARAYFGSVVGEMARRGCDAVGLCCTELPLLFQGMDAGLPLLDSTMILAQAALERSQKC